MKRIRQKGAAILLSLILVLAAAPVGARAEGGVSLTYKQTAQGDVVLGLSGLDAGTAVYGVELELTLAGTYEAAQVVLSPADPLAYSPGQAAAVTQHQGRTTLTVFLTSAYALNDQGALTLGALTASGMGIIPESARVSLFSGTGATGLAPVAVTQSSDSETPSLPFGDSYPITAPQAPHGACQVLAAARENQVVTIYAQPEAGYKLGSLIVTDAKGQRVAVLSTGNGQHTFRMPGSAVEVQASFVVSAESYLPFTDVKDTDWFYNGVQYVFDRGMMVGTSDTLFSPKNPTTRAMIVSILYRLEGEPQEGALAFPDVPAGKWYSDAIAWAASHKIVEGYSSGKFGPMDKITREQMVAVLYRYAQYKGYDTSAWADLSGFKDLSKMSGYAAPAMHWAVGCGLVSGLDATTLSPKGNATRAQVALVLQLFCSLTGQ